MSNIKQRRNEGVSVRPFAGSRELHDVLEAVTTLEVRTGQDLYVLSSSARVTIPPSEMRVAGITLKVSDVGKLLAQVHPMVMSREDVDFLVVALDGPNSPLRTTEVLHRGPLSDLKQEIELNTLGSQSNSAVLSNVNGRYSIEFALVHNKNVETVSAIKPRLKGALLAKAEFTIKPTGVNDQPKPKPMGPEDKTRLLLPPQAWFYLDAGPFLLEAATFDEAFDFYVDKELLETLKVAKPAAKTAIETTLLTVLIQGLCQEVAARSEDVLDEMLEDVEFSAVVRMLKNLLDVKTFAELAEQINESPAKSATLMLAKKTLLGGLLKSLEEANDE